MIKNVMIFCVLLLTVQALHSQQTKDTLFQHFQLHEKDLGDFEIHVTKNADGRKKPLIIFLDGSGNFPIYYRRQNGKTYSSLAINIRKCSKEYRVAVISKPGTPFYDSLQVAPSGRNYYPENEQYTKFYSLNWRVKTASVAIDYLLKHLPVDSKQVIVIGHSEGSQVAPHVAVLNKKVTHVVCIAGNALNQLYDFILSARLRVEKGEITPDEGQSIVDSLYSEYDKIYKEPESVSKDWYGATYKKWASFGSVTPLESMLRLNIPILYIAGGKDNNQTILDMDYAKLEFIRKGKNNLTYKVYPNCDHYFQEKKIVGEKTEQLDRMDEVIQFALDWTKSL